MDTNTEELKEEAKHLLPRTRDDSSDEEEVPSASVPLMKGKVVVNAALHLELFVSFDIPII